MLRNRVRCATTTTGNGAVAIGAAETGFQSFAAAYGASAAVEYLLEDGAAWEVGRGAYAFVAGAGTLSRDAIEASSAGGAAIALSGTATVSVTFLASDHVGDWPALIVSRHENGAFFSAGAGSGFATIPLNVAPTVDTHRGFDTATFLYTIPQTGTYDVQGKVRLLDNTTAAVNYGVGIDIANMDSAGFYWSSFPASNGGVARQTAYNSRIIQLAQGDQLRLFTYVDSGAWQGVTAAELIAVRIR